MDDQPALRASDADREQTARQLHAAAADGRLTMLELDDRLREAYRAKTLDELVPLTRDLSPSSVSFTKAPSSAVPVPLPPGSAGRSTMAWAVMSEIRRGGRWVVPERFTVGTLMGGAKIDLRKAIFSQPHITISANAVMGGIEIVVPDDIDVVCDGIGIMGGFESRAPQVVPGSRGSIRVVGFSFWAGVVVRPASKKERKNRAS